MDKSTAQAIHDLHLYGRLSDDSTEVVRGVLGLDDTTEDEDTKGRQAATTSKGR